MAGLDPTKAVSEGEHIGSGGDRDPLGDDPGAREHSALDADPHDALSKGAYTPEDSLLIDRLIAYVPVSRAWVMGVLGLLLFLLPATFAYIDGISLASLFINFRAQFLYALIIVYLLIACHHVQKTREGVAGALRPIVQRDESTFRTLVQSGCRISPVGELSAFGIGLVVGLAVNIIVEPIRPGPYFMIRYAYLSRILIYGAYFWSIYVVFSMTGLTNALLRQPLNVDVFDLRPFEPIGRQSLWLSLTLVVAMLLSLATSNFSEQELRQLYLINFGGMLAIIVSIFFLDTHNVHWILAAEKRARLNRVERYLARDYYQLEKLVAANADSSAVATEMYALDLAKQELRATRTWPYNTEMLRTIVLSVITPLAVGLSRLVAALLTGGGL